MPLILSVHHVYLSKFSCHLGKCSMTEKQVMQDTFYLCMAALSLTGTKLSTVTLGAINSLIPIQKKNKK